MGIYTPLWIPKVPCKLDTSMNYILGLPNTNVKHDSIFTMLYRFFKMAHYRFVVKQRCLTFVCIFIRYIVELYGVPSTIILDKDTRFVNHLWQTLWKLLRIKLKYFIPYHPHTDGQTTLVNRWLVNILEVLCWLAPSQLE